MYRRSSREKGYYLVETAGVWKSAAIRQTSLAPANYLKPPLYTPAPTPTISFPKSVARIIKLVEESSGEDFFPCHPPLSCNHPPFSSFLLSASSTYAPPRPSDSISPLSPFSLFLSFLQFFPFVFRLSSNFDVSLFSISIFVFTYLTLISLSLYYIILILYPYILLLFVRLFLFHRVSSFCSCIEVSESSWVGRCFVLNGDSGSRSPQVTQI